ncbi:MAG: DUF3501 family protein [Alphaproteobacteria bacterium]|nr:DUF3501 family protein [Alphaproteobacteria bacterium]
MQAERRITRADILDPAAYEAVRADRRRAIIAAKRDRRVEVGPHATFYFENFDTMWLQIQEMLRIERGGEEQLADELAAYNPLVPQGDELVATLMFEIDDRVRRHALLSRLGHVEETIFLEVAGTRIRADWERDVERTKADGKTSSIHFIRFRMSPQERKAFADPASLVVLGIGHENYAHMAVIPPSVRAALATDFA